MPKFIKILLSGIATSLFFFPFELYALIGINSKMVLAVMGVLLMAYNFLREQNKTVPTTFLVLAGLAMCVSLVSYLSITINRTEDTTYVSYIVSFIVWLSAAYACCVCILWTHGNIFIQIVVDYLTAVCLFQCIMAILIDSFPVVQHWVDRYFSLNQPLMHDTKRLYGIGAALDVAGCRFSLVLVALAFYLSEIKYQLRFERRFLYILSFLIIFIIGNMISRTTLVGGIGGLFIVVTGFLSPNRNGKGRRHAILLWLCFLMIAIVSCFILYHTNPSARRLLSFAFEGFFSFARTGKWETSSTDILINNMVVFPESLHTWLIGDGYFLNPRYDVNYLGNSTIYGFYMGTDIGYLRFLFYFGILGFIPLIGVLAYSAVICIRVFREERFLFILDLLVGLIVWMKVSTDVFLIFALYLCVAFLSKSR